MNTLVYEQFTSYLNERLNNGIYTTEDSVRYSFFASLMLSEGVSPSEVIQEYPHNAIMKAEVDTFIPQYDGGEAILEFKYHRAIPSGKNSPRPQKAGQLFQDLHRLLQFNSTKKCIRLLVYLTDDEMVSYMPNPNSHLKEFFALSQGETLNIGQSFFSNKSATFQNAAGGIFQAQIENVWRKTLVCKHELRIYGVQE